MWFLKKKKKVKEYQPTQKEKLLLKSIAKKLAEFYSKKHRPFDYILLQGKSRGIWEGYWRKKENDNFPIIRHCQGIPVICIDGNTNMKNIVFVKEGSNMRWVEEKPVGSIPAATLSLFDKPTRRYTESCNFDDIHF